MITEIKNIDQNTNLVYADDQLHIMQGDKKLISGFSYMGAFINNLIPLCYEYKDHNVFKYYDLDTNTEYSVDNVDWISGFHYVGNNLNTIFHNFRTDPTAKLANSEYVFNTDDQDLINEIAKLKGYSSRNRVKSKYDAESDSFIKFKSDEIEHVFTADLFTELLNSIKYIRIVGSGHLGFAHDFTSKPVKHDGQVVFSNRQLTLDGSYGVMDIREGKMIVNCEYKFINILPWAIQHSTGDKSSYFTKKLS
jgi:hypothetical protein